MGEREREKIAGAAAKPFKNRHFPHNFRANFSSNYARVVQACPSTPLLLHCKVFQSQSGGNQFEFNRSPSFSLSPLSTFHSPSSSKASPLSLLPSLLSPLWQTTCPRKFCGKQGTKVPSHQKSVPVYQLPSHSAIKQGALRRSSKVSAHSGENLLWSISKTSLGGRRRELPFKHV